MAELQVTTEGSTAPVFDCWNNIGVAGNGSCRELIRFVHCRNCPVYSAAAIQLLDRPLTDDYRREWSEHYAREKTLSTPARTSVVIFRVASEWLALPTQAFQEVAERRATHTLPQSRRIGSIVLGLVNVRGELLVCISLGQLLGLAGPVTNDEQVTRSAGSPPVPRHTSLNSLRLLVANWGGDRIAFPVDEVHGTHRVHQEQLREPPATISKSTHTYSHGVFAWHCHTVGFLDADGLFSAVNRRLSE